MRTTLKLRRFLYACVEGASWGWQVAADVARGHDPHQRHRSSRPTSAKVGGTPWVGGPACAVAHGIPTGEDSPLLAEMTAIHLHTAQLPYLATQEDQRDFYQHLARIQIRRLFTGWQQQTGGTGTIEDLLPRGNAAQPLSPASSSTGHNARTDAWQHDCSGRAA